MSTPITSNAFQFDYKISNGTKKTFKSMIVNTADLTFLTNTRIFDDLKIVEPKTILPSNVPNLIIAFIEAWEDIIHTAAYPDIKRELLEEFFWDWKQGIVTDSGKFKRGGSVWEKTITSGLHTYKNGKTINVANKFTFTFEPRWYYLNEETACHYFPMHGGCSVFDKITSENPNRDPTDSNMERASKFRKANGEVKNFVLTGITDVNNMICAESFEESTDKTGLSMEIYKNNIFVNGKVSCYFLKSQMVAFDQKIDFVYPEFRCAPVYGASYIKEYDVRYKYYQKCSNVRDYFGGYCYPLVATFYDEIVEALKTGKSVTPEKKESMQKRYIEVERMIKVKISCNY